MDIRPYLVSDREACLAVFDSNTPQFFHPSERESFADFLEEPDCSYFVMEHEGGVVGCGGFVVDNKAKLARLVWGMVRRKMHRAGLGRYLLLFRLREIGRISEVETVRLDTSQSAAPFFERQGFRVLSVVQNGYAPGFDRVELVKRLTVCA